MQAIQYGVRHFSTTSKKKICMDETRKQFIMMVGHWDVCCTYAIRIILLCTRHNKRSRQIILCVRISNP